MSAPRRDRGLSLLELVVAILVLSVAVLGSFRALDASGRQIGQEETRLLAGIVAANRAETLRLAQTVGHEALPDRVRMGRQWFAVTVRRETTAGGLIEARITVRAESGPGAVLVAYLPPGGG